MSACAERVIEMDNELLVRVYDVGFGDCLYVQIPDKNGFFTMLIDCGTSGEFELSLAYALKDIRSILPEEGPKKRLDLLVVTHPHADHLKGFDPDYFKDIKIGHIWLSCFMMKNHPQAKKSHALQALAEKAAKSLVARGISKKRGVNTLLKNTLCNPSALKALRTTLPDANGIESIYVSRDLADPEKKYIDNDKKKRHKLSYSEDSTCFKDFEESGTCLRILAPEWDIDGYYLGKEGVDYDSVNSFFSRDGDATLETEKNQKIGSLPQPFNISKRDFRLLCDSLSYSALAFAQEDETLRNNTSVVLLLEWRGRRLLFTGDAEWNGKGVRKGHKNSSWDIMLKVLRDAGHLSKPLDFLKVGHHGSVNGTPFVDKANAVHLVLDQILPKKGDAKVVVSTLAGEHGKQKEVPYMPLMEELANRSDKPCEYAKYHGILQPQRTDEEKQPIDVRVKPGCSWTPD
jgi:beta-lactamase superfamily II metal-dependent hydrolase